MDWEIDLFAAAVWIIFITLGVWLIYISTKELRPKGIVKRIWNWAKIIIGLFLILTPFTIQYIAIHPLWFELDSCYHHNDLDVYNETDRANQMPAEWTQEVEEYIANTIEPHIEGNLIAHTKYAGILNPTPVRVWRSGAGGVLEPDSFEAFQNSLGYKQSPDNPDSVFWFTLTDVSQDRVCVYVEQLYNAGFSGGRGGNGRVWLILKKEGRWVKTEGEKIIFLAD